MEMEPETETETKVIMETEEDDVSPEGPSPIHLAPHVEVWRETIEAKVNSILICSMFSLKAFPLSRPSPDGS